MQWFTDVTDINDLRNQYKKLLIKYHPDNNPSADTTNIMQEINSEYDTLINKFTSSDSYTERADFSEDELKQVLNEVIKLKADITIEVVGTWIWISGNTYSIKHQLKQLNFKWASQKKMWYWGTLTHGYSKSMDMSLIRMKYGSTVFHQNEEQRHLGIS